MIRRVRFDHEFRFGCFVDDFDTIEVDGLNDGTSGEGRGGSRGVGTVDKVVVRRRVENDRRRGGGGKTVRPVVLGFEVRYWSWRVEVDDRASK